MEPNNPTAYCPNCKAPVALDATSCPACKAVYASDSWGPVDGNGNYLTPHVAPGPAVTDGSGATIPWWARLFFIYPLLMIGGGGYAIAMHRSFDALFSAHGGKSGMMMFSFIGGVPLVLCAVVVYLIRRANHMGPMSAMSIAGFVIASFVFLAGTVMQEGVICIVLALPLFIVIGLVGALIGWAAGSVSTKTNKVFLGVGLFVPLLFGAAEDQVTPPERVIHTERVVHIDAPAATVWKLINYPLDIHPEELKGGFAYRIGVPYPIEARTLQERNGGRRQLLWQRGVRFEEEITEWTPNQRIAWKYIFTPQSFPSGSLDDHITIGGLYFTLVDTAYTLTPEGSGTQLRVDVTSRVSTNFNWYAGASARFLIGDTAETILGFYRKRAEAKV